MYKFIFAFIGVLVFNMTICAPLESAKRDSLFLKTGEKIKVKILYIKNDTVFYQILSDTAQKFLLLADIKSVNYDDGKMFIPGYNAGRPANSIPPLVKKPSSESMYYQGVHDAQKYYKNRGLIALGIALGFTFTGGILLATIISIIKPSMSNIYRHDTRLRGPWENGEEGKTLRETMKLFDNPTYKIGYRKAAHKKKAKWIWIGTGVGLVLVSFILLAYLLSHIFVR